MSFSELKALAPVLGLQWDEDGLFLNGTIKDYPVYIADLIESREYLLTLFCRVRDDVGDKFAAKINLLLENMPKNCVNGRKNELNFQQIRFNADFLYQENIGLLRDFALNICAAADSLELLPTPADTVLAAAKTESMLQKKKTGSNDGKPQKSGKSKNAVSKGFDKYSLRGLFGAIIGGAAMAVISSTMADNDPANIGALLSSWAAGALIALVTLADYSFLAKKIDIFGTIACSLITLFSCFFCSVFGIVRIMTNTAKTLDPSVSFMDSALNWQSYAQLFPNIPGYFVSLIIKNLFMALAASVIFYTFYYRRHQDIMYSDGVDILPDEGEKKKNKKGKIV